MSKLKFKWAVINGKKWKKRKKGEWIISWRSDQLQEERSKEVFSRIEATRKLLAANRPDKKAQEAIWRHGCRQIWTLDWTASRIEEFKDSRTQAVELCCSKIDEATSFGNVGLLIKGYVRAMFGKDIFSEKQGYKLVIDSDRPAWPWIVKKYDDLYPGAPIYEKGAKPGCFYCEAWVKAKEVVGAFILKDYAESHPQILERLRNKFERVDIIDAKCTTTC